MNIIIFGTGKTAEKYIVRLRDNVRILAVADNECRQEGYLFAGYPWIPPERILDCEFDYVAIVSIYEEEIHRQLSALGIDESKIISVYDSAYGISDCSAAYGLFKNNPFEEKMAGFLEQGRGTEVLITGISYHNDGIDTEFLPKKGFNFAMRGQDLYYDFQICRYLYESYRDYLSRLSHIIVGLSYYSFEYDFSKSSHGFEVIRYYPRIPSLHNLTAPEYAVQLAECYTKKIESYQTVYSVFKNADRLPLNDEAGRQTALAEHAKNYPVTVLENRWILRNYIDFLEKRGVTPVFVIMPVTSYYRKFCPVSVIERFYKNLYEVLGETKYQILDYFKTTDFPDSCWYHVNHLNKKGAGYFTELLQRDIDWQLKGVNDGGQDSTIYSCS